MRFMKQLAAALALLVAVLLVPVALMAQAVADTTVTGSGYTPTSAGLRILAILMVALVALAGNKLFEFFQVQFAKLDALSPDTKRAILAAVTGVLTQLVGMLGGVLHVTDITQITASGWGMILTLGVGQLFKLLDNQSANHVATVAATAASTVPNATPLTVQQAAANAKAGA